MITRDGEWENSKCVALEKVYFKRYKWLNNHLFYPFKVKKEPLRLVIKCAELYYISK